MAYDFISSTPSEPFQEHPDYVAGMAHLQAGRWQEALELFKQLQTVYPDDPEVKKLLEDTQMRATTARFQPKKSLARTNSLSLSRLLIGLSVVLLIVAGGYVAYTVWIGPLLTYEFRAFQVTDLRNKADEAIASGDYSQARQALQQLQALLPEDPETKAALNRIEQIERSTLLYDEAKILISAGNWDQALETLLALQNLDTQYRDLPQLIASVQESQRLEKQFQEAETVFEQGEWITAITHYEALQQDNLSFRYEEVQARIFESHLKYAQSLLDRAGTDPEQITEALAHLSQALKLRPIDNEALNERHLVETYLAALTTVDRDEAIVLLQTICEEQPDYAGQSAAQYLYALLLERGDTFLEANNQTAAMADYQQAAELAVEDTTEAQERLTRLTNSSSP